jgi:putative ABC transport system substrate-binding protein
MTTQAGEAILRRRQFITLLGGAAAAWPVTAQAQADRARRIGVLMGTAESDPEAKTYIAAFVQGLNALGWTAGRNVQIDYRWTEGDAERIRAYAAELIALAPNAILAYGTSHVGPLQRATRSIPIVFVQVSDPVGAGLVASLAHPGGNSTGFTVFEYGMSAKWLELLKEIAPRLTRVAVLRDPANPSGTGQFGAIQAVAPSLAVEASPIGLHDADEIERGLDLFARGANGGIIVTPSSLAIFHRDLIIKLAERYRLPAIYPFRPFVSGGGLVSYGPDVLDEYRQAAGYIDRILKGDRPADMPVQAPTKYELAINLKTAKALSLQILPTLLARADEVVE